MNNEYKGFTIEQLADGRFYVQAIGYGFNIKGYATLNNAKGAITKHVAPKSRVVPATGDELKEALGVTVLPLPKSKPATSDNVDRASIQPVPYEDDCLFDPLSEPLSDSLYEGGEGAQPVGYTHPARTWPFDPIVSDSIVINARSRNKREGRFLGRTNGKVWRSNAHDHSILFPAMVNRKQRKAAKLERKAAE